MYGFFYYLQVCEVYKLHRETFHLAADIIDRYLSARSDVQKYQLQLIGVTALFIAAKLEVGSYLGYLCIVVYSS